jgi:selenide,water dikinase
MGLVPEGTFRNKQGRMRFIEHAEALDPVMLDILFDPQTSGGLLAAVPANRATQLQEALTAQGVSATLIGETGGRSGTVEILA